MTGAASRAGTENIRRTMTGAAGGTMTGAANGAGTENIGRAGIGGTSGRAVTGLSGRCGSGLSMSRRPGAGAKPEGDGVAARQAIGAAPGPADKVNSAVRRR